MPVIDAIPKDMRMSPLRQKDKYRLHSAFEMLLS